MIAAIGDVNGALVVDAAVAMSQGKTACHEFADCGPRGEVGGMRHNDGWGAAYRDASGGLVVRRGTVSIVDAPDLLALRGLRTTALVIHARNASLKSQVGLAYTHPIVGTIAGNTASFFHNGFIPHSDSLLAGDFSDWDSANLLAWLMPALESDDRQANLTERLEALPRDSKSANFILLERDRLTICNWFGDGTPKYYSMHSVNVSQATIVSSEVVPAIAPPYSWTEVGNKRVIELLL